jgi:hypothetical protein
MIEHVCAMKRLGSKEWNWPGQSRSTVALTQELVGCLSQHLGQIRVCCLQVEVLRRWVVRPDYFEGRPSSWLMCVSKRVMAMY